MLGPPDYATLLALLDTRAVEPDFPDMLRSGTLRAERLDALGLANSRCAELAAAIDLRDALLPVVLDAIDDRTAITIVNRLCREYQVVPQLDDELRVRFVSLRSGRVATLARIVLPQAVDLVASGDRARVAICAADDCAAPYVGQPAPRPREFCSSRCSTRVRVRRHRAARTVSGRSTP